MKQAIKYFCVSDIHSFYKPLMDALTRNDFDIENKNHKLILCGDAFDRGDDTAKVFEFLKKLKNEDRLIYITGNHEDLLFDCIKEMTSGKTPGPHHFHNGTVKTICMLCGESEWIAYSYNQSSDTRKSIEEKTKELLEFIKENCIDYFKLGNKIFVHSWIPLKYESEIHPLWDANINDLNAEELSIYNQHWATARWGNPYLMWKKKLYLDGKCIVFGHWHCSWGHSHIDMETPEYPQKNQPLKWEAAWKPWIKENSIGIDSCVAYSGKINCIVFDENGDIISNVN